MIWGLIFKKACCNVALLAQSFSFAPQQGSVLGRRSAGAFVSQHGLSANEARPPLFSVLPAREHQGAGVSEDIAGWLRLQSLMVWHFFLKPPQHRNSLPPRPDFLPLPVVIWRMSLGLECCW